MSLVREVLPGLHAVALGSVNAFIVEGPGGLLLIDTGAFGNGQRIVAAIEELGHRPSQVRQIVVTHCHADHAGGLAVVKRLTGAPASMHRVDADLVERGRAERSQKLTPGLRGAVGRLVGGGPPQSRVPPAPIDTLLDDGDDAGGLRALYAPGHTAGHLALLWERPGGNVLFAGDACASAGGLGLSMVYEDLAQGRRTLARLAQLDFEFACFGHGREVRGEASKKFRRHWGESEGKDPKR